MNFEYTINADTENPIMLINKHIGMDSEDGEGIMGDKFTRELMFLDTLNKKKITVWINSGGGVVTDGEQIFHAILNSRTPVDTVNTGTAASIALPIFAAGRKREMMDYAKNMAHPVSGGDTKSTEAFETSIRTMLSSRSFLSENQVKKMMDKTTWLTPSESKDLGLCTEINYSHGLNTNSLDTNATSYKDYSKIVNKLIDNHKNKPMIKVTNKLGLNESANEDAILNSIEALENKYKVDVKNSNDELAKAKTEMEASANKYNELKAKFDAMEVEVNAAKELEATNKAESLKVEAKEFATNNVKLGKIENKAEVIEKIEAQYLANPEGTKEIFNSIPQKVTGAKFDIDNRDKGAVSYTAMDINNDMKKKYENRK